MREKWGSTVLLFVIAIIWGLGFLFTQIALDQLYSVWLTLALRFLIAALCLLVVFRRRLFPLSRQELKIGGTAGLLLFLGFFTQTQAQTGTNLSNVGFFTAAYVIIVPFIAWAILRKRPGLRSFMAAVVCLGGVFLLNYHPEAGFRLSVGDGWAMLCAFGFAGHIVYLSHVSGRMEAGKLTFLQMTVSAVLSFVGLAIFGMDAVPDGNWAKGLLGVLYLGMFSTCLGFFLQTYVQRRASAGKTALILSTESVWCAVFSVLAGYEAVSAGMISGGLVILLSVLLMELPSRQEQGIV